MAEGPPSKFSEASRTKKLWTSVSLFYCFLTMGVGFTILNPAIVDFSHKLNAPVEEISVAFTVMTAGYLIGALGAGLIIPFFNRQLWVLGSMSLMSTPFFVLPHVRTKMAFFAIVSLLGLGGGGSDCVLMAWIIDLWRGKSGPFILALHAIGSLGTLIPPLILAPFLNQEQASSLQNIGTNDTPKFESNLVIPFSIGGAMYVLALIIQLILYFAYKNDVLLPDKGLEMTEDGKETLPSAKSPEALAGDGLKRKILLVLLTCLVLGFYQGMEVCTSQFMATFSHFSPVKLSEADSAGVSFALQLGFAGGRFIGVFLVVRFAAYFLILGSFVFLLVANVILLVIGGSSLTWLRVGAITMGLGFASVFPAIFAFMERYLFITDSIAAATMVFGGLVQAVYPLIVGSSVENNPEVMTYVNFFSIGVCTLAFGDLFSVTFLRAQRLNKGS